MTNFPAKRLPGANSRSAGGGFVPDTIPSVSQFGTPCKECRVIHDGDTLGVAPRSPSLDTPAWLLYWPEPLNRVGRFSSVVEQRFRKP